MNDRARIPEKSSSTGAVIDLAFLRRLSRCGRCFLNCPAKADDLLIPDPQRIPRRISKECLLALAALIFCCSHDRFLVDEQSRQAEYDRLTALPDWARTFGEIVRCVSDSASG
jgi:hypothetical protein